MKKAILIFMVITMIFTSWKEEKVMAAEPVTEKVLSKAVMELLLALGVSYGIDLHESLESSLGLPYTNAKDEDKEALNKMVLSEGMMWYMEHDAPVGYASWYYDNEYDQMKFVNTNEEVVEVLGPTVINGEKFYINPCLVMQLIASGQWEQVAQANRTLNMMSITSLKMATQVMGQKMTDYQVQSANATKACLNLIAGAVQGLKIASYPSKYTPDQVTNFENMKFVQGLRYYNLPTEMRIALDSGKYPYYMIIGSSGCENNTTSYYSLFISSVPITKVGYDYGSGDKFQCQGYGYTWNNTYGTTGQVNERIFPHAASYMRVFFSTHDLGVSYVNYITSDHLFPYPLDASDKGVITGIPAVGVFPSIVGATLALPKTATSVFDLSDDEIKTMIGTEVTDGSIAYENDKAVTVPDAVDAEKEYSFSIFGWLSDILDAIISIPQKIWDFFTEILDLIWQAIKGLPQAIWDVFTEILDLIYQAIQQVVTGIKAVADAIIDIFVIDWSVVGDACTDLSNVWENKFGAVISIAHSFEGLSAGDMSEIPPTITLPCPDILKPYMKSDTITVVDLKDFADSFKVVRGIITAFLWVGFGYCLINNFVPKFNVN